MQVTRKWFAAVNWNGTIYVIGGRSEENTDTCTLLKNMMLMKLNGLL